MIVIVEYIVKLKYGDFFGFVDCVYNDFENSIYFEFFFCLSLSVVIGIKLEVGLIKDILIVGIWEVNSFNYLGVDFNNYFYGIGFDFVIFYF